MTVVFLWVVFTWPHFRPAFTLEALGKMLVLALLANVCYSAAYPVDWLIQTVSWSPFPVSIRLCASRPRESRGRPAIVLLLRSPQSGGRLPRC